MPRCSQKGFPDLQKLPRCSQEVSPIPENLFAAVKSLRKGFLESGEHPGCSEKAFDCSEKTFWDRGSLLAAARRLLTAARRLLGIGEASWLQREGS